jgi:hypothetical protein
LQHRSWQLANNLKLKSKYGLFIDEFILSGFLLLQYYLQKFKHTFLLDMVIYWWIHGVYCKQLFGPTFIPEVLQSVLIVAAESAKVNKHSE